MGGQRSTAAWREKHKDVGCSFFPARPVLALQWIIITVSQNNYKPRISKTETRGHFWMSLDQPQWAPAREHRVTALSICFPEVTEQARSCCGGRQWAVSAEPWSSGDNTLATRGEGGPTEPQQTRSDCSPHLQRALELKEAVLGKSKDFQQGQERGEAAERALTTINRVPEDSGSARAQ